MPVATKKIKTLSGKLIDKEPYPDSKTTILQALQGRPVYMGTVSLKDKLARRKKNKAAKVARRGNR